MSLLESPFAQGPGLRDEERSVSGNGNRGPSRDAGKPPGPNHTEIPPRSAAHNARALRSQTDSDVFVEVFGGDAQFTGKEVYIFTGVDLLRQGDPDVISRGEWCDSWGSTRSLDFDKQRPPAVDHVEGVGLGRATVPAPVVDLLLAVPIAEREIGKPRRLRAIRRNVVGYVAVLRTEPGYRATVISRSD